LPSTYFIGGNFKKFSLFPEFFSCFAFSVKTAAEHIPRRIEII